MMKTRILTTILTAVLLTGTAQAQTDMTSAIVNPDFDGRSFAGWQQQGMWFQTNSDFSGKSNYAYVERWVANTGNLPDTYIRQTITGLTPGRYTLTVAAQSIKQDSSTDATGAVVFADWQETTVTSAGDYTVTFDVLTDDVTIGFRCENSTANWMACDNWRLTQVSTAVTYMRTGLSNLVSTAQTLVSQSMDGTVKSTLQSAISTANNYVRNGSAANIQAAATTLKAAMKAAERSIFATMTSTTGTVPTVTTNTRYARGATMIFGRSTVSSSATILEQGFCFSSTNQTPTVADERTTRYVENGGRIYCLDDLQPSTLYYIRAYAVTTDYKVGYGNVIQVYTLPKGNVSSVFNPNDADDLQSARIGQSVANVATFWSNLTSITDFTATANYASGTPTADCSYGGWIRVGSSESYQATGTLLHESGHGIGVGTHSTYYGDIRASSNTGLWYGKRATRFLQFWDNSDGVRLTGDGTHLWATNAAQSLSYTINGAHEDNHSDASYYGNSLLMQAVVEDGLAPVSGNLQGLAYTLDSDGKTFVIRNSDEDYGLKSTCLVDNNGTLQLKKLTTTETMTASNNALWTLTFDPTTQTYRIKNQQTSRYIYYATDNVTNGFRTTTSTSNEVNLRLQLSFVDVSVGLADAPLTLDCYHVMRATSTPSPQAMCAMTTTATGSTAFSNTNAATAQRWVFIDVDDLDDVQATMDIDDTEELDAFEITSAMAPYLCTGSLNDWENDGMYTNYSNGSAPYYNTSDGARIDFPFIERWVSSANTLDDTDIRQTITELPNGDYYLRGSFMACTQTDADIVIQGVTFWAGDQSVSLATGNGTPKRYLLHVTVTDGTLSFGLSIKSTNANWVAFDNLQLFYDGTEDEYFAQATPCQPVRVPLTNSTFDKNTLNGWSLDNNWQTMNATYDNFNPPFAEWWVNAAALADRSLTQTVSLRAGAYSLQAAVEAVRQDQEDLAVSGVTLRLDDESISCHTANHAPEVYTIDKILAAGEHTFGLYVENTDANWVAADNFVLRYYGAHAPLLGDINHDGSITIADITALVNILLSSTDTTTMLCYADVNQDGNISIADVTALVNMLLKK